MDELNEQELEALAENDFSGVNTNYSYVAINKSELQNKLNLLRHELSDGMLYLIDELLSLKTNLSDIITLINDEMCIKSLVSEHIKKASDVYELNRLIDSLKFSIELLEDLAK